MNLPGRKIESDDSLVEQHSAGPKRKRLRTIRDRNALRNLILSTQSQETLSLSSIPDSSSTEDDEQKFEGFNSNSQRYKQNNIVKKEENASTGENTSNECRWVFMRAYFATVNNRLIPIPSTIEFPTSIENDDGELSTTENKIIWKKIIDSEESSKSSYCNHECPICLSNGRKFRDLDSLIDHLRGIHNLNLNESDLNKLKTVILNGSEISADKQSQQYSRPFSMSRYKSRKCLLQNQTVTTASSPPTVDVELPQKKTSKARSDGNFNCLKCLYTCEFEEDFYIHIKFTHIWPDEEMIRLIENGANVERTEFWCPECSSSFVTKSTLSMHLKGTHDFLEDVDLYLEKIGYEEIPLFENQCDICYRLLTSPGEWERHVRCHGLAFIRRQHLLAKLKNSS